MPTEDLAAALNGDHDPADFATCSACRQPTFRSSIPTAAGVVIIYVCEACGGNAGPRIYIPHLERFEPSPGLTTFVPFTRRDTNEY